MYCIVLFLKLHFIISLKTQLADILIFLFLFLLCKTYWVERYFPEHLSIFHSAYCQTGTPEIEQ